MGRTDGSSTPWRLSSVQLLLHQLSTTTVMPVAAQPLQHDSHRVRVFRWVSQPEVSKKQLASPVQDPRPTYDHLAVEVWRA